MKKYTKKKKNIYSTGEYAKIIGVHKTTVWRWIRDGRLKASKTIGGHYRILTHS